MASYAQPWFASAHFESLSLVINMWRFTRRFKVYTILRSIVNKTIHFQVLSFKTHTIFCMLLRACFPIYQTGHAVERKVPKDVHICSEKRQRVLADVTQVKTDLVKQYD